MSAALGQFFFTEIKAKSAQIGMRCRWRDLCWSCVEVVRAALRQTETRSWAGGYGARGVQCLLCAGPDGCGGQSTGDFVVDPPFRVQDWAEAQWKILPPAFSSFVAVFQRLGGSGFGHVVEAASRKSIGDIKKAYARLQVVAGLHRPLQRHSDGRGAGVCRSKLLGIQHRSRACGATVSALKFVAVLLGLDRFLANLASPVGAALFGLATANEAHKEATPLPPVVIANFEMAVHDCVSLKGELGGQCCHILGFLDYDVGCFAFQ